MSLSQKLFAHQVLVVHDHAENVFLGNADMKTLDVYESCLQSLLAMMPELRQARQEKEELRIRAKVVYDNLMAWVTENFPKDKPVQHQDFGDIPGGMGGTYHPLENANPLAGVPASWTLAGGWDNGGDGRPINRVIRRSAIYPSYACLTPFTLDAIMALEAMRVRSFIAAGEQFLAQHACVSV
jgi:hypothetical protein